MGSVGGKGGGGVFCGCVSLWVVWVYACGWVLWVYVDDMRVWVLWVNEQFECVFVYTL